MKVHHRLHRFDSEEVLMRFRKNGPAWLFFVLCFALLLAASPGTVEAKKNKKKKKAQTAESQQQSNTEKLKMRDITHEQLEAMLADYSKEVAAERQGMEDAAFRRIEREYKAHQETGAPFVRDILIISGGGAKGAFGAGFFLGWETVTGELALPEFDIVTGVSTGALIAPFAFIGSEAAYEKIANFYANPDPNWSKKRGPLYLKPSHVSLFNDDLLQATVREEIDSAMIQEIADGAAEDRLLQIGATNLDFGIGRIFDVSHEAIQAASAGSPDRVHSILLASSAIPGVFPPVVIDNVYYGDGGATANLTLAIRPGFYDRWKRAHPGAPLPKYRVWILLNQQVRIQPTVTKPKWISIAGRGLGTATHSLQLFAMQLLNRIAMESEAIWGLEFEFRWVSIPDDAPKKDTKHMFDEDHMRALEALGKKMGADPSSWKTEVPAIYSFENY
jgi:hypothetical protein